MDAWRAAGLTAHERDIAEALLEAVAGELRSLNAKVGELQTKLAALEQRKAFSYLGVWDEAEVYREGDFVTHSGSLWHCDSSLTRARPGTSNDWQLAVKRGRAA